MVERNGDAAAGIMLKGEIEIASISRHAFAPGMLAVAHAPFVIIGEHPYLRHHRGKLSVNLDLVACGCCFRVGLPKEA